MFIVELGSLPIFSLGDIDPTKEGTALVSRGVIFE